MLKFAFWIIFFGWQSVKCQWNPNEKMVNTPEYYEVSLEDDTKKFKKKYPILAPKTQSPIKIVYINFREDDEIIHFLKKKMTEKAPPQLDLVVIIGDKANILGAFVAEQLKLPWIVLYAKRPLTSTADEIDYSSITNGSKTMYLSDEQKKRLQGKNILIIDDVISSGESMRATITLCEHAGAQIKGLMVAFTEGVQRSNLAVENKTYPLITMGHLPIFPAD